MRASCRPIGPFSSVPDFSAFPPSSCSWRWRRKRGHRVSQRRASGRSPVCGDASTPVPSEPGAGIAFVAAPGREGGGLLVNIHEPGVFEGVLEQWPVLAAAGALEVRLAETEPEVEAAQRLRYQVFYEEMSAIP